VDHNAALYERALQSLDVDVLLSNDEAPGLSGARNTGIRHADGDIVVFLDDDAYAEPEWLERLLEAYEDPDVVGVGGGVSPAFDDERPAFLPREFDWVVGCSYRGQPTTLAGVRNMIGANMSFRREVFEKAGGFQTSLGRVADRPMGCEETEFCIRAVSVWPGARVMLQPSARVYHQVPAARCTWSYFRSRCFAEGLSKAAVAQMAGSAAGLAAERHYVTRTLPAGVGSALADALRGRPGGGARAAAIMLGLTWTVVGYAVGIVKLHRILTPPPVAIAVDRPTDTSRRPSPARNGAA
jgi:hypothetical protein